MKRFLVRLFVFALCFLAFDKLFIFIRNESPKLQVDKRLEFILNGQLNSDVLIYGSSRGARSVIAKVFKDSLNIEAYNLSYPGSDITFHEFLLRTTLNVHGNKKPKSVILVVDDSDELKTAKSLKFRLDRMYPLVKYKLIREELIKRKEKKPIVTELLVLHQLNKSNFEFEKRKFTKNDSIMACGSMPISHQKRTFDKIYKFVSNSYSTEGELIQKLRAFDSFSELCANNKIQLIVAIPPNFKNVTNGFIKRLHQLLKGRGQVWTYNQQNPIYKDPNYFFDNSHLQTIGSYIYTNELVQYYKKINSL